MSMDNHLHIGMRQTWGGSEAPFDFEVSDARYHTYVIGKTGSGKTTLLRNLILQLILQGHGVGLIDPHGDLAEELLDHIPPIRAEQTVYFHPGDRDFPIGLNLLTQTSPEERHLVASGIVGAFKNLWPDSWGPRMEYILHNAVAALAHCPNTSLLGVNRLLTDPIYRRWVIQQVDDPYGYMWKDKKLAVHPEESPVRRLIYELFDEHKRIKTVARLLNNRGYRTRNNKNWSDTAVRFQLRDPTPKGIHRRNYTTNQGGKKLVQKPESEHIFNEVEAIVTGELWERCNAHLDARYMKRERRPAKMPAHIFSGFVSCHCGAKMYVPMRTPKYTCQKCRNSIGCQDLEEIFMEEVKGYLVKPENVQAYLSKAGDALTEKQTLLDKRRKEAEKLAQDTERMLRLYLDGNIGAEDFKKFNQPLSDQRGQMDEELVRLQSEIDVLKIDNLSSEQMVTEALDLHARWPEMSLEEKRRVAELMVRTIVVGDGEIEFNLVQLPSYQEITNWQNTYPHAHTAVRSSRGSAGSGWR